MAPLGSQALGMGVALQKAMSNAARYLRTGLIALAVGLAATKNRFVITDPICSAVTWQWM